MKFSRILPTALAVLATVLPSVTRGQTIDVEFSNLYNADHILAPTLVTGGTGFGSDLVGEKFLWVCLDFTTVSPDNQSLTFSVGTDESALTSGIWGQGSLADLSARQAILAGVSNMFYTYQTELFADITGDSLVNTAATGFQMAAWYLANGYENNIWNGVLDATSINSLIAWDGGNFLMSASENSWVNDMLLAALNTAPPGSPTVYYASPTGGDSFQSVAMFLVPEPSSCLLVGLSGGWFLLRRRRSLA
jgi:hypothetical protein